jgi:hypothetical protein
MRQLLEQFAIIHAPAGHRRPQGIAVVVAHGSPTVATELASFRGLEVDLHARKELRLRTQRGRRARVQLAKLSAIRSCQRHNRWPHWPQNRAPGRFGCLHLLFEQNRTTFIGMDRIAFTAPRDRPPNKPDTPWNIRLASTTRTNNTPATTTIAQKMIETG